MNASALLNHLWQSSAFLAAAAALAFLLRRHQARVRFWIWMAASLKFLLPFSLLAAVGSRLRWPAAPALTPAPALSAISRPFAGATTVWMDFGSAEPARTSLPWLMPLLLALTAAGSAVLLVRWCMQWRRLAGCARRARPAELQGMRVRLTSEAMEPGVFGIRRPVVLLPERLHRELSGEQMAAVLAHEHCHIRRHDNLWAALHMLVEALFWFFPPVWWLGTRLVAERERACDEAVLQSGGDRTAYAESLLAVCRFYLESPLRCAAGVSGGGLAGRVRAIVAGGWAHNLSRGRRWALYGLGGLALAGPVAIGLVAAQSAPPTSFEAASVRPSAPLKPMGGRIMIRIGMDIDPLHLKASNLSLAELLQQAYNLKPYQVVVPDWMKSERFDIQAVVSQPVSREQMLALLGPLLQKQFQIESHRETKTMAIYALKVAPGGLKAKPAKPGDVPHFSDDPQVQAKAAQELQRFHTAESGRGAPQGGGNIMIALTPGGVFHFVGIGGMDRLVDLLSRQVNKPVIDQSGVTGTYDLDFEFTPPAGSTMLFNGGRIGKPNAAPPAGPAVAGGNTAAAPAPAPSLFDALKQQLGLELDEGKGPVQLLVVDKANKTPIGN
ncbi:MAG: TIGR03435 family protein [Terriglobales bacterium]